MRAVIGFATITLMISAAVAQAADLRGTHPTPEPDAMLPTFSWTGIYAGVHGAYLVGQDTTKEYITANMFFVGLENTFHPSGFVGGIHVGANYQFGSIVAGIEADIEAGHVKGGFVDPPVPPGNPGGRGQTEISLQGSIRARLGYAFGPVMAYATGGIAAADITATYWNWPGVSESFRQTAIGYTIGGGLEYAFTSNLSVRAEYRFTEYGLMTNNSLVAFPGFSGTQEPHYHSTRLGISYRF